MAEQRSLCTHAVELHALNGLSLPLTVGDRVEWSDPLSGRIVGDDRLGAARSEKVAQSVAVVGRVGGARTCWRQGGQGAGWQREHRRVAQALVATRLDGRNHRQQHGFLSICRLSIDRLLRHPSPFSASGRAVCFCGGAIDHMDVAVARLYQRLKQSPPYFLGRPAMKAIIDRCRTPVAGWTILPPATGSQDVDDPTDNPAVVRTMTAGLVGRKQW